jgi:hypothetical protein
MGTLVYADKISLPPVWALMMPASFITFGLFLIHLMLEKEAAKFDEETTAKVQSARNHAPPDEPSIRAKHESQTR